MSGASSKQAPMACYHAACDSKTISLLRLSKLQPLRWVAIWYWGAVLTDPLFEDAVFFDKQSYK